MEVREGMSDVVLTVGPGHTLREAARMMTEKSVGAAVVIDEEAPGPADASASATCWSRSAAARTPTASASATT